MLPLPRGAVWQLLFLFCAALYINGVRSDGRVVCYYTNWSVYRPGTAKFNPQNINPYLCTHLIYAFGGFTKDNQMKPFDKYQDIEQGGYAKFTGLKTYNKQLKTIIAIGGWNEASSRFSPLVANPERRQKFIKNILKFLRQNHFDGIDLDWEYPAHREGGKPHDRENYAQFVQELRAEFERESEKTGRPRLLLTMAVPAGIEYIEKGYDIPKLNKYLDWFNVLTYDFHSSHEPSVNHHAPLYSLEEESEYNYDAELNIDYSIKFYLNAGADRDKLVLGIPTYGRSYTLTNEESTEIGAPAEAPGEQGDATREKGYLAYYEICQNIKEDPEWTVVQPNPNAMGPYAYRRNQWVGYDDEPIVRKKAQYVVDNGLGGIMFWAIDNDDFRGTCTGKPYPLIEAAKEAMLDALGLGINEVSKPNAPQKPSRSRNRENSSSTRNRIKTTEHKLTYAERKGSSKHTQTQLQNTRNRQQSTTAVPKNIKLTEAEGSSLYIGGRTTTPPPPTTPDPGTDFKCEEEGFFQHPRDCKKYYWCLDSGPSGLGIVGHQFTCPSGLYFNPAADSCDFARNVPCKIKKSTTPASTTTTTPRSTSAYNRATAATSRPTAFFRTTPRTRITTESAEEDIEYEEEEDSVPSPFAKSKGFEKDSEEDPKVIKELIELIRKVGGIDELEKHLLRKDDGTIAIKENSSSSLIATTPSTISKSLYEKVLSKPNALNSFRNRFTTTNNFRTIKTQAKTQDSSEEEKVIESHESDNKSSGASNSFSKYSSVLRGNSRQGPQNEGIEKLSEFDGFLKERKQYVTINRNRGTKKTTSIDEDEEETSKINADSHEESNEEEDISVKTTRRPLSSATYAYSTIRRTRLSTTTEATLTEEETEEKEVAERKSYNTLNRSRVRVIKTTEIPEVTEVTAGSTRYKYLERTRSTRPTRESSNKVTNEEDNSDDKDDDDDDDGDDESKNKENTVHFKDVNIENTRETQQEITINTQRTYASIDRRATATSETETTTSAAKTKTTTTTSIPTSSTTKTPITTLPILKTTTPESVLITTNIPIATTTNPTTISTTTTTTVKTTTLPNGKDVLESLNITPNSNDLNSDILKTLDLSLHINSLLTDSSSSTSTSTLYPTESALDTSNKEIDTHLTTTEMTNTTVINDSDKLTKTTDIEGPKEVNLVSKQRNKTLYTTPTRTTTTTTPPTTAITTNSNIEKKSSPTNAKKTLGVRRQQILQNRSSQTKTSTGTTTDTPILSTESVNNDFLGTVSSPRPFGFPKRRTRLTNAAGTTTTNATTREETVKSNDDSLVKKQKTIKLNAGANNQTKVSSHNSILSQTSIVPEAETSSQQEFVQQDESEVANTEHLNSKDTKVEHFKKHVVVQVDGFEGNNGILSHINIVHNVDNKNNSSSNNSAPPKIRTHTVLQEVDDYEEDGPKKFYTWRDARQPTKPTPKKKKLIVTTITTEERVRQKVKPDHATIVNVLENNSKDERLSKNNKQYDLETGKYRGKGLEHSLESQGALVNNHEYTTNNKTHQPTEQAMENGSTDNVINNAKLVKTVKSREEKQDKNKTSSLDSIFKYSTINQTWNTVTEQNNLGNEDVEENDEGGLKTKFKYTITTRGSASSLNHSESQNDGKINTLVEGNGNNQNKYKFEYTKIIRGQEVQANKDEGKSKDSQSVDEKKEKDNNKANNITQTNTSLEIAKGQFIKDENAEDDIVGKTKSYTTLNRSSLSQSKVASDLNMEYGFSKIDGKKKTYDPVSINKGTSDSADNIPYKAIVGDSEGVYLMEDESKNSGEEKVDRIYHTISREDNKKINVLNQHNINAMEALSLTQIEENQDVTTEIVSNSTTKPELLITTAAEKSGKEVTTETITEFVLPETTAATTTAAELITRRSLFKYSNAVKANNEKAETKVDKFTGENTFSTNINAQEEENNTTSNHKLNILRRKPTVESTTLPNEGVLGEIDSEKEINLKNKNETDNQTSFPRHTIVSRKPTFIEHTFIENKETPKKFDLGSPISNETEFFLDSLEATTRPNLNRGTYRPKDKEDLSSLLALDLAKKYGNNSSQTFENGRKIRPVQGTKYSDRNEKYIEPKIHSSENSSNELIHNSKTVNNEIRTTLTSTRISNTHSSNSDQTLKGETNGQKLGNKSKFAFENGTGRYSVEQNSTEAGSSNEKNTKAQQSSSESQPVSGHHRVVRKKIQSGRTLQYQNAADIESTKLSTSNFNNSNSTLRQAYLKNTGSSTTLGSPNSATDSNSQTSSGESDNQTFGKIDDGPSTSKSNSTATQVTDAEQKNSYSFSNRKYDFANKRVTGVHFDKTIETNDTEFESKRNKTDEENFKNDQNLSHKNRSSISSSKFKVRNALNIQNQDDFSKSVSDSRRGSFNSRRQNIPTKTKEVETLEDGTTRIKTVVFETINTGDNKVKTIKKTKIKSIIKQEPEYKYETEEILSTTTRRPIPRNRGSLKFQSSDLSSLLALDFASKWDKRVENDMTRARRKLRRRPIIITEEEHVEEIEEELPIRLTRPSTTTEAQHNRRTRPTRPLRTTTTQAPKSTNEEDEDDRLEIEGKKVVSTTRRNFASKRPKSITESSVVNKTVNKDDTKTIHSFAFKRPVSTLRTPTATEQVAKTTITRKGQTHAIENKEESGTSTTIIKLPLASTVLTKSSTLESTTPIWSTEQYIETTTENILHSHSTLDLKNQLDNTVYNLKSEVEKVTKAEVINSVELKNTIIPGEAFSQNLSLPIYHRRKYYQYYKDSPITYISPITVPPETSSGTNVDIAKQIHDVFNISNDNLRKSQDSDEDLSIKIMEQAKEINSELSHFLLKTPGSK